MTHSSFDSYRPPEPARRRRRGGKKRRAGAAPSDSMVPDVAFTSYYGRPVVKPPPWGDEVSAYLFLGGVAGGSGILAAGAQLTGRHRLRRNARLSAVGAAALGGAALIADLGRPDRFYNMLRTFKVTSPMSVGSWILAAFSGAAGIAAVAELDDLTGARAPLGPLRGVLVALARPAGIAAGVIGAPLSVYTATLLSDTANPTWNAAHRDLPFVFVSSASLAASGLAMITTPVGEAGPARTLAVLGVAGDLSAMRYMTSRMDAVAAEPLHRGKAGRLLRASEVLAVIGGAGALAGGRSRAVSVASGIALLAASACTRFGILDAGIESTKDPRYTIEPQRRRLEERRAVGITDDSITTGD